MKLLELSLVNFRQHRSTNFELPAGLIGIVGPNGSGKSTLIEAFTFALFGSRALRGKVEDVKTRGTRREDPCHVTLTFEHDGIVYRIERSISDAQIYIGGESTPIVSGNRDVSARISSILRMSLEEFTATFLTEQKGLEFLSGKRGAAERERFIVRMLGYDKLERVQELLRGDKRDKKNSLQGYEGGLGVKEEIELRIKREERELAVSDEAHNEAVRVVERAEKESNLAASLLSRLDKSNSEYRHMKDKLLSLEARHIELSKRASLLERDQTQKPSSLIQIIERIKKIAPEIDPLNAESYLEKLLDQLKQELAQVEDKFTGIESGWQSLKAGLRRELELGQSREKELNIRLANLVELKNSGSCPTCGQPLGAHFDTACQGFNKEIDSGRQHLNMIEEELLKINQYPDELNLLNTDRQILKGKINDTQQLLGELLKAQSELKHFERLDSEYQAIKKEIAILHSELEDVRNNLKNINFDEEHYSKARSHSDSCNRLLEAARLQRLKLEGQVSTHKALLNRSKTELKEYENKKHELELLKKDLLLLEESDDILTDFRRYLNTQIRPRLAELASEFLAELTDGRYTTVEITNDFTPTVLEDGIVKGVISGGEEDLLNLCMRLALSHMLAERAGQTFSLLVLDEVFGSLDENRRINVLTLLDRLGSQFEQIVVITHLEDIREGVQFLYSVDYHEASGELVVYDRIAAEEEQLVSNL